MKEKEKKVKKKKRKYADDDGRTIANMNVEGFSWYQGKNTDGKRKPKLTRSEKWALFKGSFLSMLPVLFVTLAGLTLAMLLILLWLS